MSKTKKGQFYIYGTCITAMMLVSQVPLLAKVSVHPLKACRPCNDIAFLLTSQPNAQQITQEHQVVINLPLSENKKIVFVQDNTPCFYLYKQHKDDHEHTCIIGTIDLKSYDEGSIKKHELTLTDKACDLETFIETQQAEVNPVLLIYNKDLPAAHAIHTIIADYSKKLPTQSFISGDGIHHSIWAINKTHDSATLQTLFDQIPTVYVADGHHRLTVAHNLREKHAQTDTSNSYNYLLAAFANSEDVTLGDFNRIVKNIPLKPDDLMDLISHSFDITHVDADAARPTRPHTFGMYLDGSWYHITAKPDILDHTTGNPLDLLDMQILHKFIINPLLLHKTPDTKIEYLGGIKNTQDLGKKCSANDVAFAVYPMPMDQFMAIIDAGQLMPPKTTWFEPKLPPGLVVYALQQ